MAKKSELVVEGEILDLVEGRSFGNSDEADDIIGTTAVFHVRVSKVLQGGLPPGSDNLVYVEKFGIQEPAQYAAQLPEKNSSLFCLYPAGKGTIIPGSPVVNDGAGHPKGQPLFSFATQGYLMQGENSVFQVIDGVEFPGATLADFSPEARTFPPTAEELQEASD